MMVRSCMAVAHLFSLCSKFSRRPALLYYSHSACKLNFFNVGAQCQYSAAARERMASKDGDRGKVEVNGVKLYYERSGAGAHTVLCMPGALGSAVTDFGPQLKYFGLEKGDLYTCVSFDPRGYGSSRPPKRLFQTKPENFLRIDALDAHALMRALGFPNFSVLGWSDGGVSAIILASLFPEAVKKLVVWGTSAYIAREDVELFEITRNVRDWSRRMREPMEAMYGADFPQMWSDWIDAMTEVHNSKKDGSLCVPELSQIKCPTLILHGVKDPLCPQFHAEYLREHIKESKLELFSEGKHNLHLRFAKEFNVLVTEFLAR